LREKDKLKIIVQNQEINKNYPFMIMIKRHQMIKEGENDHLHDHFLDFDFSPFFADFAAFFFAAIFIYIKKGNRI
jgi:hypothetical protein